MKRLTFAGLVFLGLYEIVRYEVMVSVCGAGCVLRHLREQSVSLKPSSEDLQRAICEAVLLATCFYWKSVLCLQRSVSTVRVLRKHGINARLAIGYRPAPFFSHAWVEIDGHVAYGSSAYQERLQRLLTA